MDDAETTNHTASAGHLDDPATSARYDELAAGLAKVQARITEAAELAQRNPAGITLLPVTKYHPVTDVALLHQLGVTAVGESRINDAASKAAAVPEIAIHFIGQVQSKKTAAIARTCQAVHSVDSLRLVQRLEHGRALAVEAGLQPAERPLQVYLQYSYDNDPARGGTTPERIRALASTLMEECAHLTFAGIMMMPPPTVNPKTAFAKGAELLGELSATYGRTLGYSAGMSQDLEVAIGQGATIVRVGTAILGSPTLR
ncbi:YggS family pyridoxal phosphate-dependent enzyme [Corynebacterium choanae]|uniref:Pyridoxal phosphate homeostasis protein n=1 Tax=Corynebacterium choanae TaxID=1862358 RepID=A0A3G6J844_9CORY|nr:YggS family pyridoxal phosphate-dependent enzyme [Corynebacterium choanae]AZA13943.1 hypothetical protein CCHOA_07755 [Corynebacterium choanae]